MENSSPQIHQNKMNKYFPILIFNSLLCFSYAYSSLEYDGMVQILLEHSLDGTSNPEYTERGNISIPSIRLGSTIINQAPLTDSDRLKIQKLAVENRYYHLRSTVVTNEGSYVFNSNVKACMLAESELTDILSVTLDYTGRIITITESVASTSTCQGANVPVGYLKEFSTSVIVRHTHSGPGPDTASYIQKLEREREAKERGDVKDNRSFLAKYWMYIVPVVIIMVLSSAANPEAGGAAPAR